MSTLPKRVERLRYLQELQTRAQELEARKYNSQPVLWAKERLGEYLWAKQREICESVVLNRYTAVQSCHDAGKSFVASRVGSWWLDAHTLGEAFLVSTAPTAAQVEAILWREITRAHKKGNLAGRIVSAGFPQWKMDDGELIGYGRKPNDYDDSAFQGIHARYPLIIVDEAGGVPRGLFDAVDALATNEDARVLAIGNPDDPGSHFAQICKPNSGWNVIRIDGLRTPNMTATEIGSGRYPLLAALMAEEGIEPNDEAVPEGIRPLLLSPLWVEERLHRWVGPVSEGEQTIGQKAAQSALFTAKVRGLFPESGMSGVIPLGWVERAIDRWRDWNARRMHNHDLPGRRVIGVDVAREGEDETCIVIRQGWAVEEIRRYAGLDTMETVDRTLQVLDYPQALSVVDVIGVGAGVVDRLRQMRRDVIAFNASAQSGRRDVTGEFGFQNDRAAAWWRMRELLDPSKGSQVMLPDDDHMRVDLTAPRWSIKQGAKIAIESKDDIRKRLGRSTDTGDAVVQSFWVDGLPINAYDGAGAVDWTSERIPDGAIPWGNDEEFV